MLTLIISSVNVNGDGRDVDGLSTLWRMGMGIIKVLLEIEWVVEVFKSIVGLEIDDEWEATSPEYDVVETKELFRGGINGFRWCCSSLSWWKPICNTRFKWHFVLISL